MTNDTPVFDVSGALAVINQSLEYAFPIMSVVGELDSFKVSKGKWVYADLKDDYAKMRIFGTVFMLPGPLQDGMMVEVVGQPRVHSLYGFSFNVQSIRPVGEGSLKKAANLLCAKLEQEGLFDESRKREVPYPPARVGLVTSVESAAYADFVKIMNSRWQGVSLSVYDVQVQGDLAVETIVAGINYFSQSAEQPDVLVLIRGGGSVDDLSAFSTEQVVRAVASSRIPTCVAIGHETDESLAELAADMRASTPSNAAELLFPSREDEIKRIMMIKSWLDADVRKLLNNRMDDLQAKRLALIQMVESEIEAREERLVQIKTLLEAMHPRSTLKRGFALVSDSSGRLVSSKEQLMIGSKLNITFRDGSLSSKVIEI